MPGVSPKIPRDYKYLTTTLKNGSKALGRGVSGLSTVPRATIRKTALLAGSFCLLGAGLLSIAAIEPQPAHEEVRDLALPGYSEPEALPESVTSQWQDVEVRPGQTLAQIFSGQGLTARDVHNVVSLDEHTRRLAKIYPGDTLSFLFSADGTLAALEYQLDEQNRLKVTNVDGVLQSELIQADLTRRVREAGGVIRDSLFLAGREAGLTDSLILETAYLFGWDVDFVLDIRAGDSFHVIYEDVYRNGEFLRTGDILAATFINQGKRFQAVRFENEGTVGYFSPDGRNMKKAFLRAPLNFSYISSSFNPKRFHPILKRVKAHNGIDYRAPSGTPVYAAGDGRVVRSAYTNPNGHHVFIEHPTGITTKYLHFTRRTVNKGDRVSQGDVIGYVGATGLATAPHLHYEFILNGVHRNPATVDLPKALPLPEEQLQRFQQVSAPLLAQLDRLEADQLLASSR